MGGSPGSMAPSPTVQQVSSPLTSMVRPPTPACLTKSAPQHCMQSLSSPSHPHNHVGGSPGPMAPSPAIQQVSSPSTITSRPPTPAPLTKTAPHQHMQSLSSPSPPILKGGEHTWHSIELQLYSTVRNGASDFIDGSTSRLS